MADRLQLVAILASVALLFVVLEMVRRRRLMERYALLWLLAAVVLIVLAVWRSMLVTISRAVGIIYAPNALFFVAFAFVLLLLLHFSAAVSRLSDQTKVLAQRVAMLEEQQEQHAEAQRRIALEVGAADDAVESEPERMSRFGSR